MKSDIEILLCKIKDYWQRLPENVNKTIKKLNEEWDNMKIKDLGKLIQEIRKKYDE